MKPDHLYRYSPLYALLKKTTSIYHSIYYEEISVVGKENIPKDEPVIFTPNHQNALMDALAIIFASKGQPVFMARADIFKSEFTRKMLHFLKIIPVFRIRDGIESLSNNDQSFESAYQVLKNKGMVGIMPEGNHGEQRRLRSLKKGFARLAIQSQDLLSQNLSVKIVPVGLDYSDYSTFRGKLLIIFGKPVEVPIFLEDYKENPARALQSLRSRVAEQMKPLMIDINSETFYETIYQAKELYSKNKRSDIPSLYDKFKIEKLLVEKLVSLDKGNDSVLIKLKANLEELTHKSEMLHIAPWIFGWNPNRPLVDWLWDLSRALVFLPIFLFTMLFHAVPFFVSEYLANRVKDKQFISSMRFAVSFILYIVWYLLFLCWPISILLKGLLFICMPILGLLSVDYWKSLKIMKVQFQYLRLGKINDPAFTSLKNLYTAIIQQLNELIETSL